MARPSSASSHCQNKPLSLDSQSHDNSSMTSMTSATSDAEQQKSRQNSSPPRSQATTSSVCDEAQPSLGDSKETAICIFSDPDTEDEDEEDRVFDDSQSYTITTTITDHSDTTSIKHSPPRSEATVGTDTTRAVSPARIEADPSIEPPADPEPNQQPPCQSNPSSAGGFSACIDASLDLSPASPENQPYLVMLDRQQLVTAFTGPASEPGITTIDALSDEGSCRGGQSSPTSPSASTHSPVAATPGDMAHALLHSEVCAGTSPDDATLRARNSSLAARISPEPHREQDLDDASCGSCDAESEAADGGPGSPFGAQASPQLPSPCRSRRISPHAHATAQEEGNGADTEGSSSEDGLDDPRRVHDEDYCPRSSTAQGPSSGDDSDDEEQFGHQLRRISRSRHTSVRSTPASIRSSPQSRSTRRIAQSLRGHQTSAYGIESPAPSQARPVPSEASTFLGRFEEWPLRDVLLKRITEGDKTTFQLQFEWTPDPYQPRADRSATHPKKRRRLSKASRSAVKSSGERWTPEEDETVCRMRRNGYSWADIQSELPHRSEGTIQVRYSTKLKHLPNSM